MKCKPLRDDELHRSPLVTDSFPSRTKVSKVDLPYTVSPYVSRASIRSEIAPIQVPVQSLWRVGEGFIHVCAVSDVSDVVGAALEGIIAPNIPNESSTTLVTARTTHLLETRPSLKAIGALVDVDIRLLKNRTQPPPGSPGGFGRRHRLWIVSSLQ